MDRFLSFIAPMTEHGQDNPVRYILEERLREVKKELESMAQLNPDCRDFRRWQELVSEETELMEALCHAPGQGIF
jgi:hypothetical protein